MKGQITFVKSPCLLQLLLCILLVGCYGYKVTNVPIKPIVDRHYNSYKQINGILNVEDVNVFKYASIDAIPSFIEETTELVGDASWKDSMQPNDQDIVDLKEYAKNLGADVVIFVFSTNRVYAGSSSYSNSYYYKNINWGSTSTSTTANYSSDNFWYIGFRRTIK